MITPLQGTALYGLHKAQQGMHTAASRIVQAPHAASDELNRSFAELKQHRNAAVANVKVLSAADRTIGTLLDELA